LYPIDDPLLTPEERQEQVERTRERYGLNDPVPVQYIRWVGLVLRGDLGTSIRTREPVREMITDRLPATVQLAGFAMVTAIVIAIPAGVIAAVKRNTPTDLVVSTFSMSGVAIPNFFLGMLLILVFTFQLKWLPAPGNYVTLLEDPGRSIKLTLLPAITLGFSSSAFLARLVRSSLLEVLAQDYIRTAWAKGLRQRSIIVRHALRNSLLPVVTVLGLQFIALLGGTVIIEQIFAIPGVGRMVLGSIRAFDFPVVQGFVLFIGVVVVVANLVVDLLYAVLDPRIRIA
jgi:peptide/nickel transport system permease protein